jgi:hypothetical protein|tara:strand:+ start:300 stop:734 length:435 start_codon:yes stop_codon:yes gene_type:complete
MGKFEDNGGYFIEGVPYMDCKITGIPVKNVSTDATSVISDRALMIRMNKMFPETLEKAMSQPKKKTGRPAGWHWMNEFVDKDGNVFHKGVEQPKLKGTLPPTKVKPKKKTKRRSKDEILVAKYKEKQKLKKEFEKQKDFLNHKL